MASTTILDGGEQNVHHQQIMTLVLCFTMTLMPTMFSHNKIPQRLPGKMDLVLEFCYTETARVATTCLLVDTLYYAFYVEQAKFNL
jgi:hypothetical protein